MVGRSKLLLELLRTASGSSNAARSCLEILKTAAMHCGPVVAAPRNRPTLAGRPRGGARGARAWLAPPLAT
eukprot:13879677-Alexandrium_andersonii.AAC.1